MKKLLNVNIVFLSLMAVNSCALYADTASDIAAQIAAANGIIDTGLSLLQDDSGIKIARTNTGILASYVDSKAAASITAINNAYTLALAIVADSGSYTQQQIDAANYTIAHTLEKVTAIYNLVVATSAAITAARDKLTDASTLTGLNSAINNKINTFKALISPSVDTVLASLWGM